MSKKIKRIVACCVILLLAIGIVKLFYKSTTNLSKNEKIEKIVQKGMRLGNIPGLSIYVKDSDGEYINSFGYSDQKNKQKVTNETCFQLGSTSKAFTGLAIELLMQNGSIKESDIVTKYLPDFYMVYDGTYKGEKINGKVDITIEQLLHHTSGIPSSAIVEIPENSEDNALEDTINKFIGLKLKHYPGEYFEYSTINYDILGLIIEKVSGQFYEEFIQNNIFRVLNMNSTTASIDADIAKGYKQSFLGPKAYYAPIYKGNVPAGYIVSNIEDMSKWINLQLGIAKADTDIEEAILQTQISNRKNLSDEEESYYCVGWYQKDTIDGTTYYHGGKNPNYSSYIIFNKDMGVGICIMANASSEYVNDIGNRIMNYYTGNTKVENVKDMGNVLNTMSRFLIIFLVVLIVFNLLLFGKHIKEIKNRSAKWEKCSRRTIINLIVLTMIIIVSVLYIKNLPWFIYHGADWKFAKVWMPDTLIITVKLLIVEIIIYYLYYVMNMVFRNREKIHFYPLIVVSIISGLGNAAVIFVINTAIARGNYFDRDLFIFFLLGLGLYILGQRIVRYDLVEIANDIVYEKRKDLLTIILRSRYEAFAKIDSGQVQSCLNNDTEVISNFSNTFVTAITCFATVMCCFLYMFIVNIYGFFVTAIVVVAAIFLYRNASARANENWEKARTCQSVFFRRITDLLLGFKELSISVIRKSEFMDDILSTCRKYKEKTQEGGFRYAGVFIIGESVFTFVIGTIVFLFPLIFPNSENANIREYVFVLLYITGPINGILNTVPELTRVKISWNRIKKLTAQLAEMKKGENNFNLEERIKKFEQLTVKNLYYQYADKEDDGFGIGPVNAEFKKGQISFIIGGNGSGKSTFVNLITGLYEPTEGEITVNGKQYKQLGELFSTVYSDYYLFEKLYGIDTTGKSEAIVQYITEFGLENKVTIVENEFSTTKLSSGQRKRLALLLAYLEDKPVFIFDEWAADQDPRFKNIFYNEIIQELKKKGKCIIAITHDDNYFDVADQVLCMKNGQLVKQK